MIRLGIFQPTGEVPYITYNLGLSERKGRSLEWLGRDMNRDESRMTSGTFSGTIIISARAIARKMWWDLPALRAARPVARFGNMLVFRGTFDVRGRLARNLYSLGIGRAYAEKPDLDAAERILTESAAADPSAFFVHIELGNIHLKHSSRDAALQAYGSALTRTGRPYRAPHDSGADSAALDTTTGSDPSPAKPSPGVTSEVRRP